MRKIILFFIVSQFVLAASAIDMSSVVKAQILIGQVSQVVEKYREVQDLLDRGVVELSVNQPIADGSGKFVLPFNEDGTPTEWAGKALMAKAGAEVGAMAGDKAAGMLAAKIPFGGLFAASAKNKSKELGAVMAIGGWDYIRENSTLSFNNMKDYSVYMHSQFNGLPGYEEALAAAMSIYPKLERSHKSSVDRAYKKAKKEARKIAKINR